VACTTCVGEKYTETQRGHTWDWERPMDARETGRRMCSLLGCVLLQNVVSPIECVLFCRMCSLL
jgi:hypothetical protein